MLHLLAEKRFSAYSRFTFTHQHANIVAEAPVLRFVEPRLSHVAAEAVAGQEWQGHGSELPRVKDPGGKGPAGSSCFSTAMLKPPLSTRFLDTGGGVTEE